MDFLSYIDGLQFSVHLTLYSVQCIVYSVQCTLFMFQHVTIYVQFLMTMIYEYLIFNTINIFFTM